MRTNKEDFIKNAKLEKSIYEDFIKAIEVIKDAAKRFDGKVIDKRFINAANEAILSAGLTCNRIKSSESQSVYISIDEWNNIVLRSGRMYYKKWAIYYENDEKKYIIDKRLNYAIFIEAANVTAESIKLYISNRENIEGKADLAIRKYKELNEYIKSFMEEIPAIFRTGVHYECPIY